MNRIEVNINKVHFNCYTNIHIKLYIHKYIIHIYMYTQSILIANLF